MSEKQRFLLEEKWKVEQEEINKELELEKAQIAKDTSILSESQKRETAEVQRSLAGKVRSEIGKSLYPQKMLTLNFGGCKTPRGHGIPTAGRT
ncbi:MAG: hypothetical protein CM1200mP41_22550 [Gammaproteobacteria bacterium]|nr:MAG: hypothetical protein CM1200mP41_22550 [Gammaproteobacteria bacterium]